MGLKQRVYLPDVSLLHVSNRIFSLNQNSPQATHVLGESDFQGHTVLMHAASAGSVPVFRVVHQSVASTLDKDDREVCGTSCHAS